jgi:hypothetical protein
MNLVIYPAVFQRSSTKESPPLPTYTGKGGVARKVHLTRIGSELRKIYELGEKELSAG